MWAAALTPCAYVLLLKAWMCVDLVSVVWSWCDCRHVSLTVSCRCTALKNTPACAGSDELMDPLADGLFGRGFGQVGALCCVYRCVTQRFAGGLGLSL